MEQLQTYIAACGLTQRQFADSIGADQSMISRIMHGKARPSLDLAMAIERETRGLVPVAVWSRPNGRA